jgi:hypothetical protein
MDDPSPCVTRRETPVLERPPSRRELRRRRYRARRAAGVAVYPVPLTATEIDWLVRMEWLDASEVADRKAVGEGIARMLAASARR